MSLQNAFIGSLVADSVAMPMHWYYDVNALDADYGSVTGYLPPRSPHPDSILWRSIYTANGPKADILHEQKEFWGKRGIHYHQSLKAGENTLNLQLSTELYRHILLRGEFKLEAWLRRYAEVMLTPVGTMTPMPKNTTGLSSKTMRAANLFSPAVSRITTSEP